MPPVKDHQDIEAYYASVSQSVIELIKKTDYAGALELLEQELAAPYIPINFYNYFLQTKDDVEKLLTEQTFNLELDAATKLQLWDKVFNTHTAKLDLAYLNLLLEKHKDELEDLDIAMFKKILKHPSVDNGDKAYLVSLLKELNVDTELSVWNNYLAKTFDVNPCHLVLPDQQIVELAATLEEHFFKDPSKLEIAMNLLQVLQIKFFPIPINFPINDIIDTIINVTNSLFGNATLLPNSITKLFDDFLK